MPVENDGSAAAPDARRRLVRPWTRTYSLPPETNAMREQLPDTATAVDAALGWWLPGSGSRRGLRPGPRETNASTTPLVSRGTRVEAADRKAMQRGRLWNPPLTAGANDGPFDGAPERVREMSRVPRACHGAPRLPMW